MAAIIVKVVNEIETCPGFYKDGRKCGAKSHPDSYPYCRRHEDQFRETEQGKAQQHEEEKKLETRVEELEQKFQLARQVMRLHHNAIKNLGDAAGIASENLFKRDSIKDADLKSRSFPCVIDTSMTRWKKERNEALVTKRTLYLLRPM